MLRGQAWWWNITNLGAQMKDLMVTDDPASSPRSSVGNSPRPGTAGTGSKVPSVRGEPDVTFKEELPESTLKRAAKVAACTPKLERRFGTADLSSSTAGMKRKPPEPSISPARLRRCWRFLHQEVRAQTAPGNVGQTPKLQGAETAFDLYSRSLMKAGPAGSGQTRKKPWPECNSITALTTSSTDFGGMPSLFLCSVSARDVERSLLSSLKPRWCYPFSYRC
eukprot:s1391_g10.t1